MLQNKNQAGFHVLGLIIVCLAVTGVGLIGFSIYAKNQKNHDKLAAESSKVKSLEPAKTLDDQKKPATYQPPKDWVAYNSDTGLKFYYPGAWGNSGITVDLYRDTENIPSKFGTPDSIAYSPQLKAWTKFLNYGTSTEEVLQVDPNDEYRIRTTTTSASDYPIAYVRMGHAAAVTYDILVIHKGSAFRIRLPEINTFDEDWTDRMAAESAAVPNIIKSLSFTN